MLRSGGGEVLGSRKKKLTRALGANPGEASVRYPTRLIPGGRSDQSANS